MTTVVFDIPALWAAISGKLLVLAVLTVLDFLLGTVIAVVKKNFKMEYMMHILESDLLPILGWLAVFIITSIPTAFIPQGILLPIAEGTVYGIVFLGILASVLKHLADIGILNKPLAKLGIDRRNEG
jgi:hypothetical protein